MRNSPYVFATFCSHYLMLTVLFFALWMPAFGDRGSDMFFIWFLAAPLVSMAIAIAIVHVALKFVPPLATLITGGRLSPIVDALPQMARRRSDVLSNQI